MNLNPGFFITLALAAFLTSAVAEEANTVLLAAASEGRIERLVNLLAEGADVNFKSPGGRTSLMIAATAGNIRIIRKLLAFGADPNLADNRGVTAIMDAAAHGHEEAVKTLIAAGTDLTLKDAAGNTVLDRSKKIDNPKILALIEKASPPPTAPLAPPASDKKKPKAKEEAK
ncbi:ankyrin repeat domain-containing protein [Candidatus Woesearchaeota archaeon]|nr:ankyrin repeat domain-containing protein [Candidatus Woesearchaeota archaeon]